MVAGERVLAHLALPLGGLMSDLALAEVVARVRALEGAAKGLGARLSSPMMALSFLALPVIPELRLTDMGLVDVARFSIVPLGA